VPSLVEELVEDVVVCGRHTGPRWRTTGINSVVAVRTVGGVVGCEGGVQISVRTYRRRFCQISLMSTECCCIQGASRSRSSNDSSEPENRIGQRQNRQDDADDTEETPLPFAHTYLWNWYVIILLPTQLPCCIHPLYSAAGP
jgi:hypothetical protein